MTFEALQGLVSVYVYELCVRQGLIDRQLSPSSADLNAANRLVEPSRSNKPIKHDYSNKRTFSISGQVIWNKYC